MVEAASQQPKKSDSNGSVLLFVIVLCFACAFLLAVVSFALSSPQEEAKEFERNKQMLIATKILTPNGKFQILDESSNLLPAYFDKEKKS